MLGQSVTIAEGDNLELTATVIGTPTVNWDLDGDGEFDDAEGVTINVLWNTLQPLLTPLANDVTYPFRHRQLFGRSTSSLGRVAAASLQYSADR